MVNFVNPYTFVEHVVAPGRRAPGGHALLGQGMFSGQLTLRITARVPLLVGGFGTFDGHGQYVHEVPRRSDGTAMLPGSGLHGAIRSVHEALTGSCLRVLNAEYEPVHRDAVQNDSTAGLKFAVVREVDEAGLPTKVAQCERLVRISKDLIADHPQYPLRTGDRLHLPEAKFEQPKKGNRPVLRPLHAKHPNAPLLGVRPDEIVRASGMHPATDGTWALLITDTRARSADQTAWFTAGKVDAGREKAVSADARERLRKAIEGANDLGTARLADVRENDSGFEPVYWPPPKESNPTGQVIGERLRVTRRLHVGQPVWVRMDSAGVSEIRLSQFWRHPGRGTVGERVGQAAPCTDPNYLCPSCRVFGSADADGRDADDIAKQSSYRGHVRIDDAVAVGDVATMRWELAPLSAPRPSAGQFYLDNSRVPPKNQVASKDSQPAAFWGSVADDPPEGWRPIRGRKFYWRTADPTRGEHPRGRKRPHHSEKLTRTVQLIREESTFTARITFDGLSRAQLGGLVAAADPRLLWPGVDVVTSVGGGKPFGFGAVMTDVVLDRLETAADRYLGDPEPVPTLEECVAAFREPAWAHAQDAQPDPESASADAQRGWAALRNALTLGYVSDELVWYPPGTEGPRGSEKYDQGFDFWKGSAGIVMDGRARRLVSPPSPAQPPADQVLRSVAIPKTPARKGEGVAR